MIYLLHDKLLAQKGKGLYLRNQTLLPSYVSFFSLNKNLHSKFLSVKLVIYGNETQAVKSGISAEKYFRAPPENLKFITFSVGNVTVNY